MAELDWNTEAFIAQFTRGLHWKVKELLSTKDNIPDDDLEAIFAASIKIDNIRRENEENRPKKTPAKSPATVATTSTTTTQRVRLTEDPNYVTPEERDRRRASGLCVKCGQKGHGIKQCPNGWKATVKEVAKPPTQKKDIVDTCVEFVSVGLDSNKKPLLFINLHVQNSQAEPIKTLIDSGATSNFISPSLVEKLKIPKTQLKNPQVVRMLDGTISQTGRIWHQVHLTVLANGHTHSIPFLVCPIGNTPAILGMTWLTAEAPLIDWQQGLVTFPEQIQIASEEEADPTPLADLPPQYHKFAKVFGEEEFKVLPPHREYDISIDLVSDAKLSPGPIYGMTDAESKALKQHIDEELATGKIRPSTSSAGAPVMFVKKADGSLRLRSHSAQKPLISPVSGTYFPHAVLNIPSTRSGVPHPYSRPSSRSSRRSVPTQSQLPSRSASPTSRDLPGMEPEPSIAALLKAVTALTATVGSLQDQIRSQGQQLTELKAICKETADLLGDKDQGGTTQAQTQPGPLTGPITPPSHTGGQTNTPRTARPGLRDPFRPTRGTTGYDSEEEQPRRIKEEPCGALRDLRTLTPFSSGSDTKRPKMELPDPFKGDIRGRKAVQWLDRMLLWGALHRDQFEEDEQLIVWILYHMEDKAADWALPLIGNILKGETTAPTTIPAMTAKFKEAFADPDAKRAAARKIAVLSQSTTTSEYVTEFRNLMAELDWNEEAYIAQFTQGLHWKVKELLSTKDNIPDKLEAIFAASIKIDNTRRKNEENRPKKAPAKSPVTATTSTSTTTTRVRLSEDPNYVTPEEQDRRRASGLCVKCGQKGHGIKQCPNGWKATPKETAKVAQDESEKE
ncbi:Retrotransposon gag protein [Rhizoctonia solani]|uniref:Retrotransposon gag protein n=1 Tax=Rhizoctonia solani TaxID=456999 RepID=A0A8H8T2H0_9AGAM|nr:Retrotransposon gag protein [Rhizoctonia solani]QRW26334.1 Retrotransposon gag protein [Rhizoctonia solani]